MKALISPNDVIEQANGTQGARVCELHPEGFDIAEPLFWVDYDGSLNPSESIYINGVIEPRTIAAVSATEYNMPVTDFGA